MESGQGEVVGEGVWVLVFFLHRYLDFRLAEVRRAVVASRQNVSEAVSGLSCHPSHSGPSGRGMRGQLWVPQRSPSVASSSGSERGLALLAPPSPLARCGRVYRRALAPCEGKDRFTFARPCVPSAGSSSGACVSTLPIAHLLLRLSWRCGARVRTTTLLRWGHPRVLYAWHCWTSVYREPSTHPFTLAALQCI